MPDEQVTHDGQETTRHRITNEKAQRKLRMKIHQKNLTCAASAVASNKVTTLNAKNQSHSHEHNIVPRIDCNLNHEVLNYSVESAVFETDRFATCTMLR